MITLLLLLIIAVVAALMLGAGGVAFLVIFGDAIVAGFVIYLIIKKIFKK